MFELTRRSFIAVLMSPLLSRQEEPWVKILNEVKWYVGVDPATPGHDHAVGTLCYVSYSEKYWVKDRKQWKIIRGDDE